jgi:hypothetical protein
MLAAAAPVAIRQLKISEQVVQVVQAVAEQAEQPVTRARLAGKSSVVAVAVAVVGTPALPTGSMVALAAAAL